MYMHAHTLYGAIRPFGVSVILASLEEDSPKLFMVEPSGVSYVNKIWRLFLHFLHNFIFKGYNGCAVGKAAQTAKTEIEKLKV